MYYAPSLASNSAKTPCSLTPARKGFLYADWRNAKWRNVCQACRIHIRTGFTFEGSLRRIVPMIVDFFQANWITDIFDREHSHARAGSICNFFPRKFRSLSCGDRLCRHSLDSSALQFGERCVEHAFGDAEVFDQLPRSCGTQRGCQRDGKPLKNMGRWGGAATATVFGTCMLQILRLAGL